MVNWICLHVLWAKTVCSSKSFFFFDFVTKGICLHADFTNAQLSLLVFFFVLVSLRFCLSSRCIARLACVTHFDMPSDIFNTFLSFFYLFFDNSIRSFLRKCVHRVCAERRCRYFCCCSVDADKDENGGTHDCRDRVMHIVYQMIDVVNISRRCSAFICAFLLFFARRRERNENHVPHFVAAILGMVC